MSLKITIGSRGSDLALWQAEHVKRLLAGIGIETEIKVINTQGDKIQNIGFDKMEGKGFFTKEIEAELLEGSIDLAVHSHKDLETTQPTGLCIAAVPEREDASELLLIRKESMEPSQLFSLKNGAIVGTSSARRKNQLKLFRPDVEIKDLRGNVPTRINKLRDGNYDAILLAKAGVSRLELDLSDLHVEELDPRHFVPAPAQGALALQVREEDLELRDKLSLLNTQEVDLVGLERAILKEFQGGCQVPLGVHANRKGNGIHLWASAARDWENAPKRIYMQGSDPEELADRASTLLRSEERSSVFISRDLDDKSIFKKLLEENGLKVEGNSLIRTKAISLEEVPEYERIFFASKNGVQHFFEQYQGPAITRADAIGPGTASALKALGVEVGFIGDGPDTALIGTEYSKRLKSDKVLFVTAEQGSRKIQNALPQNQVLELIVYRSAQLDPDQIDAGILVFTSPSNVQAYFEKNELTEDQKVIAIGTTTKETLLELGVGSVEIPWASHELALADAVLSSINGNDQ